MFGWHAGILLLAGAVAACLAAVWVRQRRRGRGPAAQGGNPPPAAESPAGAAGFGAHLAEHLARGDLAEEVRQLREEVVALRAQVAELRAQRNISPYYAEAQALAQRGLSARDVADRMGISLAEAELVHALSRGASLFDAGKTGTMQGGPTGQAAPPTDDDALRIGR